MRSAKGALMRQFVELSHLLPSTGIRDRIGAGNCQAELASGTLRLSSSRTTDRYGDGKLSAAGTLAPIWK